MCTKLSNGFSHPGLLHVKAAAACFLDISIFNFDQHCAFLKFFASKCPLCHLKLIISKIARFFSTNSATKEYSVANCRCTIQFSIHKV